MHSAPYHASINVVRTCAQGTSPTLMHPAFGKFLDLAASAPVDDVTAQTLVKLIRYMSVSYMDTKGKSKLRITQRVLGEGHKGVSRGREAMRAQTLRRLLLELMKKNMRNTPLTLEPASVSVRFAVWPWTADLLQSMCMPTCIPLLMKHAWIVMLHCSNQAVRHCATNCSQETSLAQTDGSLCIIDIEDNQVAQVVIIEVKEDDGAASMQLLAYYACLVRDVVARRAPAALHTCLPALGIEVIGNMFRWVAHGM